MILLLTGKDWIADSVQCIRESHITVARQFKLTEQNCPSSPAFITARKLGLLSEKDTHFIGLFNDNKQIGFAALEKGSGSVFYLEKLSIIPPERHRGHGKNLVDFACSHAKYLGGRLVSIGIIDTHDVLKKWYRSLGFRETGTKSFTHLPFTVCYMEKDLL